jgi:hypothetical protein
MHAIFCLASRLARSSLPLVLALLVFGCQGEPDAPALRVSQVTQPIVNGTPHPQTVSLTDGEILAIGWLHPRGQAGANFCTGTLIAPSLVVTAAQCTDWSSAGDIAFGIGDTPSNPRRSFAVSAVARHPSRDVSLLVLADDATELVPGLTPIPANTEALTNADVGAPLDAAGYGDTYDTNPAGRWFALVYLDQVASDEIVVDGRGEQGFCYGDSGGPVIWEGEDGPVVLGVESWGDESCVGRDYLTRLDPLIDSFITPIMNGELPPDPCDGLGAAGVCNGDVYRWCQRGEPREHDCGELGTECAWIDEQSSYGCTCGEVDFRGRCNGDVLEYCEDGALRRFDCSFQRLTCGYVDDQTRYFCVEEATICAPGTADGLCQGPVLLTCNGGVTRTTNCETAGLLCVEDATGAARCDEEDLPSNPDPNLDAGPDIDLPTPAEPLDEAPNGGGGGGNGSDGCTQVAAPGSASPVALALLALVASRRRRPQR